MKSQSLLSQRSNLSQLSNVSYHGQKKQYHGSQFFRQSLPPGHNQKASYRQLKQQQIQLQSLGAGFFRSHNTTTPIKQIVSAFTPYWTSQLHNNINVNVQGTSDNQNQPDNLHIQQPDVILLGRKQQNMNMNMNNSMNNSMNSMNNMNNINSMNMFNMNSMNMFNININMKNKIQIKQVSQSQQQQHSITQRKQGQQNNTQSNQKTLKNETKNIPKNYGKAIIIFIQNNRQLLQPILQQNGDNYDRLLTKLRSFKKKINTILDLRNLWQEQPQSKSLRIISNTFLRKYSLNYIYNSRIKTRLCHAKYKRRLQQAIVNPQSFNHIKDY